MQLCSSSRLCRFKPLRLLVINIILSISISIIIIINIVYLDIGQVAFALPNNSINNINSINTINNNSDDKSNLNNLNNLNKLNHASKLIEAAPIWADLTPNQRQALQPMQPDWQTLEAARKQKWLIIAERYHQLSPLEQRRMHSRMVQWAKLTPAQRTQARDNYLSVLSSPASATPNGKSNLHEQWAKYQALSPEAKAKLLEQANAAHKN